MASRQNAQRAAPVAEQLLFWPPCHYGKKPYASDSKHKCRCTAVVLWGLVMNHNLHLWEAGSTSSSTREGPVRVSVERDLPFGLAVWASADASAQLMDRHWKNHKSSIFEGRLR